VPTRIIPRTYLIAGLVVGLAALTLAAAAQTGTAALPRGAASGRQHRANAHRHHTRSHRHRRTPPLIPNAAAPATAAFGLDLIGKLGPGNQVFSPDSIAAALAMAGSGANGTTATQIARVLHLGTPRDFDAVGDLQNEITAAQAAAAKGNPEAPTLDLANALFLQTGFPLESTFTAGLADHFGVAAPQTVDFEHDAPAAVQTINEWVDGKTQGVIPHVLESVPPESRLALVDAVYLHAAWLDPFKATQTRPESFFGERGTASIRFMHESDELSYGSGGGYAAVELPYSASTLSLLVLVPVGQNLASLERTLTPTRLTEIVDGLAPTPVELSLPRFHLAFEAELKGPLQALGMNAAFGEDANFTGINPSVRLKIGFVRHDAEFTVDEKGTEAAAATVVGIEVSAEEVFSNPVVFDADHPFLFFLRDDHTGAVLFCGRLADPMPQAG
jgi:serpin B